MRNKENQKKYFAQWYVKNKKRKNQQSKNWYKTEKGRVYLASKLKPKRTLLERFTRFVSIVKTDQCIEWPGSRSERGYGRFNCIEAKNYAHRASFLIFNGKIPEGFHVCHTCDNPPCVNPKHLWVGTVTENMHDREIKGRGRSKTIHS